MRRCSLSLLVTTAFLCACGAREDAEETPPTAPDAVEQNSSNRLPAEPHLKQGRSEPAPKPVLQAEPSQSGRWEIASSGEGDGLYFSQDGDARLVTLFCPADQKILIVNIPSFRPIGSEERLSVGARGVVTALVANTEGDRLRGGLSGQGAVPPELKTILSSGTSVSYADQVLGPLKAVPSELVRTFVAGCSD